jgi:hypothetical protein
MRIVGYSFLILGFLWLLVWCGSAATFSLTRAIGIEHFKKYSPNAQYSGADVVDAIRDVLTEYRSEQLRVGTPGVLMVVGAIL